jgi:hypothetical protein
MPSIWMSSRSPSEIVSADGRQPRQTVPWLTSQLNFEPRVMIVIICV